MADATYDAVIIGAGHNGLALGTYLAKSGWDVAIFEKRAEEGGGLCTEELTRPGFLHNVHCNYHTLVGVSPVYADLELEKHGLRYELPPVQMGSVFDDGTALTIHTDLDKTCASIARFSQKDADTFRRLIEETKGYLDLILVTLMYSPPVSMNDITRALAAWGVEEKAEFLSARLRSRSINEFLDQHFENDKVKAHLATPPSPATAPIAAGWRPPSHCWWGRSTTGTSAWVAPTPLPTPSGRPSPRRVAASFCNTESIASSSRTERRWGSSSRTAPRCARASSWPAPSTSSRPS
jgi:phytoene dehydrogenase-like protein